VGVSLHDRLRALAWLAPAKNAADGYATTAAGDAGLRVLGLDLETIRSQRRRFAYPCVDWSERRPHLAGALAAALLVTVPVAVLFV